ncbi:hypothetical protein MMC13_001748 [Lambiella insularis]|nr:hypothetical protein [Lambiella insularis]
MPQISLPSHRLFARPVIPIPSSPESRALHLNPQPRTRLPSPFLTHVNPRPPILPAPLHPLPRQFHPAMEPTFQHPTAASAAPKTPERCVADFCLIPIGTPTASVSRETADVQRLLRGSGLVYEMHSAGTTVGEWEFPCGFAAFYLYV